MWHWSRQWSAYFLPFKQEKKSFYRRNGKKPSETQLQLSFIIGVVERALNFLFLLRSVCSQSTRLALDDGKHVLKEASIAHRGRPALTTKTAPKKLRAEKNTRTRWYHAFLRGAAKRHGSLSRRRELSWKKKNIPESENSREEGHG